GRAAHRSTPTDRRPAGAASRSCAGDRAASWRSRRARTRRRTALPAAIARAARACARWRRSRASSPGLALLAGVAELLEQALLVAVARRVLHLAPGQRARPRAQRLGQAPHLGHLRGGEIVLLARIGRQVEEARLVATRPALEHVQIEDQLPALVLRGGEEGVL